MVKGQTWRRVAACRPLGPAVMILGEKDGADRAENIPRGAWWQGGGSAAVDRLSTKGGVEQARRAVDACRRCPVAEDCMNEAMEDAETGDLDPWAIRAGHLPGELEELGLTMELARRMGAAAADAAAILEGRVEWMRTRTL